MTSDKKPKKISINHYMSINKISSDLLFDETIDKA